MRAYADAIGRAAYGRRAIDIGSGPHCLLARLTLNAGASRVDAVEQNDSFVSHAIDALEAEAAGVSTHPAIVSLRSCAGAAALGPMFDVTVALSNPPPAARTEEVTAAADAAAADGRGQAPPTDTGELRCEVALKMKGLGGSDDSGMFAVGGAGSSDGEDAYEGDGGDSSSDGEVPAPDDYEEEEEEDEDGTSSLQLHHGYSTVCSSLRGGYTLVVHEILGHVASSEGAVGAIADLHERGLIAAADDAGAGGCAFIPAAAGTMLTPTSPVSGDRSLLEELVHRYCELQSKCHLCSEFSIENEEIMENFP